MGGALSRWFLAGVNMGRAKAEMMEHEANLARATDYLVHKGLLEKCEAHEEVWSEGWDIEKDFWRDAMADRNRGINGPVPWAADMQAREYTDLLTEAYKNQTGDGCGRCAKLMAED